MKQAEENMAEKFNLTAKLSKEIVKCVISSFVDELVKDGEIKITGLGSFTVVEKDARQARNPKTGETIQVAAKKALKFKPSKVIKDAINA